MALARGLDRRRKTAARLGGAAWHILASTLASIAFTCTAYAAAVDITGDEPRKAITVKAENSTADEILKRLADKYGFRIKAIEHATSTDLMSATLSGSLQEVIVRLLRNRNHMIVRSPNNASGIDSVMILDESYGAAPSTLMPGHQADDVAQGQTGS
jgi:hypothetical protein